MVLPHLVLLCLLTFEGGITIVPKHIGAPASDLLNGRLRSPDPASVGRPFGHAMIPIEFDDDGIWHCSIPIPSSPRLSILPLGHGCDRWDIQLTDPQGRRDDLTWSRRIGDLQPFVAQQAVRIDVEQPVTGDWTLAIYDGQPRSLGYLLVRDHSDVALQIHTESYSSLVGQPKRVRVSLAPVDQSGDPLMDTIQAFAKGIEITHATMSWLGPDGLIATEPMERSGPWLEHSLTPRMAGPHECRVSIEGIDTEGHRLLRSGVHHFHVETPVRILDIRTRELDDERLAIDFLLDDPINQPTLLMSSEAWCLGTGGMQPRCWIGGITPVRDGHATLVLDRRWLAIEGGSGESLTLRSLRIASPHAARPLLTDDRIDVIPLGDIDIPQNIDLNPSALHAMQHGKGDLGTFQIAGSMLSSASRSDRYGGHNLMISHGYCSDADSWNPTDFTGDVAEYINTYQNFSHDQFAQDFIQFGSQYKSYGLVGHSQGGNAAVHLYTFYWSGLDWAQGNRLIQCLGSPFGGTALAGNLSILGEIFGIGCGVNYDMTYDGAAEWQSYIPTSTRQNTWTWTSTVEDEWWSYDYCHILTDLVLWDPDDGVVENSEGDLDGANNMGTTFGWCHIKNMAEPREVDDINRSSEMDAEAAR